MKVVILAGGLGTRLSEYTRTIPKPMINIKKKPILLRIMEQYSKYGYNDFIIATGYKGQIIKNFFKKSHRNWNIQIVDTGKKTMTGGRLKRLSKFLKNEPFFMTYGDGLSNINIKKLYGFHKKKRKAVTMTIVRPPARFGFVKLKGHVVKYFKEKSKLDEGWINGGFFVMEPKFLNYIKSDSTFLEREPLEMACKKKELIGFKHEGFWQCMDTIRDKEILEENIDKYFEKK